MKASQSRSCAWIGLVLLGGCIGQATEPLALEDAGVPLAADDPAQPFALDPASHAPMAFAQDSLTLPLRRGLGNAEHTSTASWEEFRASAARVINGRVLYLVEWDLLLTSAELRNYYDLHVAHDKPYQVSRQERGVPTLYSTVNRVDVADDIWRNGEQLNLTYCVSDLFMDRKERVVAEMDQAAAAWEAVASVNFAYAPATDANCAATSNVLIAVLPLQVGGGGGGQQPRDVFASAFFPHERRGELLIDLTKIDDGVNGAPNVRSVGVFRHELGHILGLDHEHIRAPGSPCAEGGAFAALTPYEKGSVMHYPHCQGDVSSSYQVTALDDEGVSSLYGPEPARPRLHVEYGGCRQGAPLFAVDLFRLRGVAGTRYDIDFRAGSGGVWQSLSDGPSNHVSYRGANRRRDSIRARVCNSAGCSGFETQAAYADCSRPPL